MKNFRVTVNGNIYDVQVEEVAPGMMPTEPRGYSTAYHAPMTQAPAQPVAVANPAPTPVAAPVQQEAKTSAATTSDVGSNKVLAPMPGKIIDIKVSVGQNVKQGEVIAILEAMKMENEIVASEAGTVVGVHTTKGNSVEVGELIISLN